MQFLNKLKNDKKLLEQINLAFEVEYKHLSLCIEFNNKREYVTDNHSRFALYHALHSKLNPTLDVPPLTSKFLISFLEISYPTSQKILNNLVSLKLIEPNYDLEDKRLKNYTITELGIEGIYLWESFRINDFKNIKSFDIHDEGFLNMSKARMNNISNFWLADK